jgi:hypothetical protein
MHTPRVPQLARAGCLSDTGRPLACSRAAALASSASAACSAAASRAAPCALRQPSSCCCAAAAATPAACAARWASAASAGPPQPPLASCASSSATRWRSAVSGTASGRAGSGGAGQLPSALCTGRVGGQRKAGQRHVWRTHERDAGQARAQHGRNGPAQVLPRGRHVARPVRRVRARAHVCRPGRPHRVRVR